ncbi:hypothetical protein MKX03_034081, partial [Papaver bracteatum]
KENLCLYGFTSEQWEVNLPAEEVPPELPEPAFGINFARDVHSDAWILAVAFYFGARFGFENNERNRLFSLMRLPTIFEVVTGVMKKQQVKAKSSVSNHSSNKSKPSSKTQRLASPPAKSYSKQASPKEDIEEEDDDVEDEHGDTLCGACGDNYASDEFWICYDLCEIWFHRKCVKITPARAEHIKQYKCPACTNKRSR